MSSVDKEEDVPASSTLAPLNASTPPQPESTAEEEQPTGKGPAGSTAACPSAPSAEQPTESQEKNGDSESGVNTAQISQAPESATATAGAADNISDSGGQTAAAAAGGARERSPSCRRGEEAKAKQEQEPVARTETSQARERSRSRSRPKPVEPCASEHSDAIDKASDGGSCIKDQAARERSRSRSRPKPIEPCASEHSDAIDKASDGGSCSKDQAARERSRSRSRPAPIEPCASQHSEVIEKASDGGSCSKHQADKLPDASIASNVQTDTSPDGRNREQACGATASASMDDCCAQKQAQAEKRVSQLPDPPPVPSPETALAILAPPTPPKAPVKTELPPPPRPPEVLRETPTVLPKMPEAALPETTRVLVSVPIKMRVGTSLKLADIREKLLAAGCHVKHGSFRAKGEPDVIDDQTKVSQFPDMRLIFSPEQELLPWQLCLAHRTTQRLVAACARNNPIKMSFEAMIARNPFYKTKMCFSWVQSEGRCIRGARCVYAHGKEELRQPAADALDKLMANRQIPAGALKNISSRMLPGTSAKYGGADDDDNEPEVVFTVDEEEARKRAERAKRFAPRLRASFDAEETDKSAEDAKLGEASAPSSAGQSNAVNFSGMDSEGALADGLEDQITDYLLEMEQQFMSSMLPGEGEDQLGFPDFPPVASFSDGVESLGAAGIGIPFAENTAALEGAGPVVGSQAADDVGSAGEAVVGPAGDGEPSMGECSQEAPSGAPAAAPAAAPAEATQSNEDSGSGTPAASEPPASNRA